MAGKQGGGVGAFSWTLLGFLAGVAATLAVQMLLIGSDRSGGESDNETPQSSTTVVVTPKLSAPKRAHKLAEAASSDAAATTATPAPPSAPAKAKAENPDAQVADDAAAAGMTSRTQPNPNDPGPNAPR